MENNIVKDQVTLNSEVYAQIRKASVMGLYQTVATRMLYHKKKRIVVCEFVEQDGVSFAVGYVAKKYERIWFASPVEKVRSALQPETIFYADGERVNIARLKLRKPKRKW